MENNFYDCQTADKIISYGLIPLHCKSIIGKSILLFWNKELLKYKGDNYDARINEKVLEIKNKDGATFFAVSLINFRPNLAKVYVANEDGFLVITGYYDHTGIHYFNFSKPDLFNSPIIKSLKDAYNGIRPAIIQEGVFIKVDKKYYDKEFVVISTTRDIAVNCVYLIDGDIVPYEEGEWMSIKKWNNVRR